uniref:Uncharacterized protein n=1 Tax=Talaromyces marneffei PM1 TaxID=1077442 RepID=A0A093VH98_TALMA
MSDSSSPPPPRRHWNGPVGARHEHQNDSESSTGSTGSRRSSGSGKTLFETLNSQKRGSVSTPVQEQRNKSYAEMSPEKGFFAKWWYGYTTGSK